MIHKNKVPVIVRAVKNRPENVQYLNEKLTGFRVPYWMHISAGDREHDAMLTFLWALRFGAIWCRDEGYSGAILIEDDVILSRDFLPASAAAIDARPEAVIQFFSRRKDDKIKGSPWSRTFTMNQCTYYPLADLEGSVSLPIRGPGARNTRPAMIT